RSDPYARENRCRPKSAATTSSLKLREARTIPQPRFKRHNRNGPKLRRRAYWLPRNPFRTSEVIGLVVSRQLSVAKASSNQRGYGSRLRGFAGWRNGRDVTIDVGGTARIWGAEDGPNTAPRDGIENALVTRRSLLSGMRSESARCPSNVTRRAGF